MKKISFLILFFSFTAALLPQSTSLYESYGIPAFSFHTLQFSAQDLFAYGKTNYLENSPRVRSEGTRVQFGLSGSFLRQEPELTFKVTGVVSYYYALDRTTDIETSWDGKKKEIPRSNKASNAVFALGTENSWYPGGSRGVFFYANTGINLNEDIPNEVKLRLVRLSAGAGYGRIVAVRNVAQAKMICDELDIKLEDDKTLKLAELIEKGGSGYYTAVYQDDAKIAFYKDVVELLGKPDAAFKIDQILSSGLYKTLQRYNGWQSSFGLNFATSKDDNSKHASYTEYVYGKDETDLIASFGWSVSFHANKQLLIRAQFSKNLSGDDDKGRFSQGQLQASYSVQHTYNWITTGTADIAAIFPKNGESRQNTAFALTTELVVLNFLSLYSTVAYEKRQFVNVYSPVWPAIAFGTSARETFVTNIGLKMYVL